MIGIRSQTYLLEDGRKQELVPAHWGRDSLRAKLVSLNVALLRESVTVRGQDAKWQMPVSLLGSYSPLKFGMCDLIPPATVSDNFSQFC